MKVLVTGSGGLVGSACCDYFLDLGWVVHGIDNDQRAKLFGEEASTRSVTRSLIGRLDGFVCHNVNIRSRIGITDIIEEFLPDAIIHCAAQPSHDKAASIPVDDFDINAVSTLYLLEAARRYCPESPFIFLSTNKVYGDNPNKGAILEEETRFECATVDESMSVDQCMHSLFGVSKLSADMMVQEYGRYFGMKTCCLRCGCLTGPAHKGVELHGFLSYLIKCNMLGIDYTIYGHKGKQVRDNLHALDVARFIHEFIKAPRSGEVYNLGGGRENAISILEAADLAERTTGRTMIQSYIEEPRKGDHICYISDLSKCQSHYPDWRVRIGLEEIFTQIASAWSTAT